MKYLLRISNSEDQQDLPADRQEGTWEVEYRAVLSPLPEEYDVCSVRLIEQDTGYVLVAFRFIACPLQPGTGGVWTVTERPGQLSKLEFLLTEENGEPLRSPMELRYNHDNQTMDVIS
jgi:hypothetical protein